MSKSEPIKSLDGLTGASIDCCSLASEAGLQSDEPGMLPGLLTALEWLESVRGPSHMASG